MADLLHSIAAIGLGVAAQHNVAAGRLEHQLQIGGNPDNLNVAGVVRNASYTRATEIGGVVQGGSVVHIEPHVMIIRVGQTLKFIRY